MVPFVFDRETFEGCGTRGEYTCTYIYIHEKRQPRIGIRPQNKTCPKTLQPFSYSILLHGASRRCETHNLRVAHTNIINYFIW